MYLGIDIGTSSVKTVLFDRDQRLIAPGERAARRLAPAPRLVRAGPGGLVGRGRDDRRRASPRDHELAELRGIGLSGQMHGAVCLDHDDQVLRPAILWNDGRAAAECAEIEAAFPRAREVAGNIAMPGFTAPKIAWLRKHEPRGLRPHRHGAAAQGLRPLPPDRPPRRGDVGRLRHALARRRPRATGRTTCWRRPASPARHMPRLVEGSAAVGRAAARARRALGHRRRGGRRRRRRRQRRGRLRHRRGAARATAFVSLGTSGVLFVSNAALLAEHRRRGARLLPRHPRHLAPDGRDPLGHRQPRLAGAHHRPQAGRARRRGRAGRRRRRRSPSCPTSRASARRTTTPPPAAPSSASRRRTDSRDLTQAVMEGVAFAFADCQRVLRRRRHRLRPRARRRRRRALRDLAADHRHRARPPARARRRQRFRRGARRRPARDLRRRGRRSAPRSAPPRRSAAVIEPDPALVAALRRGATRRYRALYPALKEARA